MPMNSRERTLQTLNLQVPDRVPIDCWMSSGMEAKIKAATGLSREQFLDQQDVDLRYIEGPVYCGPALPQHPEGDEDLWGVRRTRVTNAVSGGRETYYEVAHSPLAEMTTVEEVEAYAHWPSPDWYDYRTIAAQCRAVHARGRAAVFMGDRLNRISQLKPAMYLRGVEEILVDLTQQPAMARAILGKVRAFYREYARRIFEAAEGNLDLVLTGDDFGGQNGPLLSPRMWTDFLGDGFADYISLAKAYGLKVMHHTCGSVRPIIPLLVERGLDVLQSLQPDAADMDLAAIKREWGRRLAFQGGISVQHTLPFGTPDQVRLAVRQARDALAPGGGYIFGTAHNLQADVPLENVYALFDAYRDYGNY